MQVINTSGFGLSEDKLKGIIRVLHHADFLGADLFSLFIEKQCKSSHIFDKSIGCWCFLVIPHYIPVLLNHVAHIL